MNEYFSVRACVCMCVRVRALPEKTYADSASLSKTTEPEPLLAIDIGQHKGEVLSNMTLGNSKRRHEEQQHIQEESPYYKGSH